MNLDLILAACGAYMLGSIPFGLVVTRLAGLGDIRQIGSGNIGATNVLRTGKKWLAALTLLLDMSKGFAAVFITSHSLTQMSWNLLATKLAALCVVLGHMYPIWLRFKGGKGVATILGAFAAIYPPLFAFCAAMWLAVFALKRVSSLSAIVSFALAPVFLYALHLLYTDELARSLLPIVFLLSFMAIYKHKPNIERLLDGTEPAFSTKGKS